MGQFTSSLTELMLSLPHILTIGNRQKKCLGMSHEMFTKTPGNRRCSSRNRASHEIHRPFWLTQNPWKIFLQARMRSTQFSFGLILHNAPNAFNRTGGSQQSSVNSFSNPGWKGTLSQITIDLYMGTIRLGWSKTDRCHCLLSSNRYARI